MHMCSGRKTRTVIDKLLEVTCGQLLVLKTPQDTVLGCPHQLVNFTSRDPYQVLRGKIWEKSLCASSTRRGKVSILKYVPSILYFLRRPALKRNYFTKPNQLGFYQSLTDLEKGKHPTPSFSSLSASTKLGGRVWKSACESHSPGIQDYRL